MSDVISRNFTGQFWRVQGRNAALATSLENMNELSLLFAYGTSAFGGTAAALDVISSSTSDAAAGTGARRVLICGLNQNYVYQTEEVALNGQTAVSTTKTFLRVFAAECTTAGTGLVNAGAIYVYKTGTGGTITGGVPGTLTSAWLMIPVGYGYGTSGMVTTPAGVALQLRNIIVGGRTQPCEVQLYSQRLDDTADVSLHFEEAWCLGNTGQIAVAYDSGIGPTFPPKTDISFRGLSSTAAGVASFQAIFEWRMP